MAFLSLPFFCFFPLVAAVYFLLPRRFKNIWLLAASWFFYLSAKPVYLAFLLFAILSTYLTALILGRKKSKAALALCLLLNGGLLFFFKYLNFTLALAGRALTAFGVDFSAPALDLLLPLGISFYLFQGAGYVIDVYRGKLPPERNFLLYALFLSFFPQLLSGPIGRGPDLLPQLKADHPFRYDDVRAGLLRFLWGAFKKAVLADRLSVLVNTAFAAPADFGSLQLVLAALAFSIQIYCDFSAYSDMALGAARMMGFRLTENFRTPYFSRSVAEFWRRWHISLSSWFRDYLYIPLGGSRKGTLRKYLNVMVVFAVSGLWHGAGLSFLVWGLLNGAYQVVGGVTAPLRGTIRRRLHLAEDGRLTVLWQVGCTFLLATVAWVFFKAGSLNAALGFFRGMLGGSLWVGEISALGLDLPELLAAGLGLLLLLGVDLASTKRDLTADFLAAKRPLRWCILWALLFGTLIFGSYGAGYNPQAFIYFQF
ncbi:MAG: MBOAT family O-acyltransferase [Pseudoflavonifractor sp.]